MFLLLTVNNSCSNSTILRLGENNLDMDAIEVIADVLQVSDSVTELG